MTARGLAVLSLLGEQEMDTRTVQDALCIGYSTAGNMLTVLSKLGLVERRHRLNGPDTYRLTSAGRDVLREVEE